MQGCKKQSHLQLRHIRARVARHGNLTLHTVLRLPALWRNCLSLQKTQTSAAQGIQKACTISATMHCKAGLVSKQQKLARCYCCCCCPVICRFVHSAILHTVTSLNTIPYSNHEDNAQGCMLTSANNKHHCHMLCL